MVELGVTKALRVGLTGGIGCGKSTVAHCLSQHGAAILDTDAISRTLTAPGGRAIALLRQQFGPDCIDAQGGMDRTRMRELVFSDAAAKRALESLLHPLINEEAQTQAEASGASIQVFDVPLLIETGRWRHQLHRIIVVDCDEATQIARVARRPGWDAVMAEKVIRQQAPRHARRACADVLIHNQQLDLPELQARVSVAVEQLQRWACGTMSSGCA